MPRFLFDLDVRATGRSPLHRTQTIEAPTLEDALETALADLRSPQWDDRHIRLSYLAAAEFTSLSVSIDHLTHDARPS